MASDWSSDQLGNLVQFKTGKLNSNAAVPNGRYPFFTCSQETFRTDTCAFDTECVLLAGNNANGIYPLKYFKGKFDAYQRTYVVTPLDSSKLNTRFLYFAMRPMLDYMRSISTGAATKFLTLTILKGLDFSYPPLPTQRKIASILSAYDDLIENNTRRIAILEEMAQAIYREWFVNFRFPGHENVKLVDSPLGQIPEGWEVKTVGDFGNVITGKTPSKKKEEYYDGEICFVKTPDMHGNLFCLTTTETLSELGRDSQLRQTVPKNSICISCIGTVGVISITTAECQTNQQINTIVPSSTHWREFIVLALKDNVPRLKQMGAAGATMDNISKGKLVGFQILHPPHDVVSEFSLLVHDMFERIKLSQRQNNVLRNTRDLLLPKLISGKLDVEDLDIDVMDPIQTTEEASS